MEFVLGVVKSQLSPFSWKTILVLVFAVGALFFAFRTFGKFNTDPAAAAVAVVEPTHQAPLPAETYVQPEYPQEEVVPETNEGAEESSGEVAAANE